MNASLCKFKIRRQCGNIFDELRFSVVFRDSIGLLWLFSRDHLEHEELLFSFDGSLKPHSQQMFKPDYRNMKMAMKLAMNIMCPFIWFETFGVNNLQVFSQSNHSFKFQVLPPLLGAIQNALIVKEGTENDNSGKFWAKSKGNKRVNIFVLMFLDSHIWMDISIWKKKLMETKKQTTLIEAQIPFTEKTFLDRFYVLQISTNSSIKGTDKPQFDLHISCTGGLIQAHSYIWKTTVSHRVMNPDFYISLPFPISIISILLNSSFVGQTLILAYKPDIFNDPSPWILHDENCILTILKRGHYEFFRKLAVITGKSHKGLTLPEV